MTFYAGRADIISLAYSKKLVNIVCLIVQNHISAVIDVSKTILYSSFFLRYPVSRTILSIFNIV
jgi:hypothetical protein